jgi:hypothetical protein
MLKDWKYIALAWRGAIPESQLERIIPVLERLEADFRPLAAHLSQEIAPALVFFCPPEERAE